ncbi:MAG: hypothetical protein J5827_05565 [Oscillospiraceae bacterium]|nr:hypothetical protein [Oscillospiraceae bacterium]
MKRRTIVLLLAALMLMLAAFAGCAKNGASGTPSDGGAPDPGAETQHAGEDNGGENAESSAAPDVSDKVAKAEDMTSVEEVVEEGMTPVYAESLVDGVYPVEMKSSSSMFKADHCELAVENGKMQVLLYMTSKAYLWMFAGTAEQAAAAAETELIAPVEDGGMKIFTLPLDALDDGEPFAAFSKNKELWYDRTLLFRADSLPAEAFGEGFFTTAESLALGDGKYTAEVVLAGGSGRASVASPALLTVENGKCTAVIEWGSPNYDYMRVDEEKYMPLYDEGNSVFEIPVSIFDRPVTVYADTTAMSQPHEIEYTLTFDSSTITPSAE